MSASLTRSSRSLVLLALALLATVLLASSSSHAAPTAPFRNSVKVLGIDDLPDLENEQSEELGVNLDFAVQVEQRQTFTVSDTVMMRPAALKNVESLPAMSNEEEAREFARWVLDSEAQNVFGEGSGDSDEESSTGEWVEPSEPSSTGTSVSGEAPSSLNYTTGTYAAFCVGRDVPLAGSLDVKSVDGSTPLVYSISPELPVTATLNPDTGLITGYWPEIGITIYTITATNDFGSASTSIQVTITTCGSSSAGEAVASSSGMNDLSSSGGVGVTAPSSLVLSVTGSLSVAQYGSVSVTLNSYSGSAPTSFSISPSLSSGLQLSTSSGAITGYANAQPSSVVYTLTASNAAGSAAASFTLVITAVAPSALVLQNSANYSVVAFESVDGATIVASVLGSLPFFYSVSPAMPSGASLSATTGVISGAPTVVSSRTYTLTISNAVGSTQATFILTVTAAPPSSLVLSTSSVTFTAGIANTVTVTSVAGSIPVVYTVSPSLPAGLAISSSTGTISGTTSALQSATAYTVTATNSAGSTTATVSIVVVARGPSSLVLSTYAAALVTGATSSSIISVSSIVGTPAFTYTVSPSLPTGLSISSVTGTISGAATTAQSATSYTITATNTVGSVSATVSIAVVSSIVAPSSLTLSKSSAVYVLTVAQTVIVSSVVGTQPMAYTVSPSLPSGLSIDVLTGTISGTALVAQSATVYTVTATNSAGSTSATVTIQVNVVAPAGLSLSASSSTLRVSQAASITATLTTGTLPVTYTVSPTLPTGLAISSSTGAITGTPTAVASSTVYTVTATNSAGSTTATVTLVVSLLQPSALTYAVSSLSLTSGVYGAVEVSSIAGSVPVTYTVSPSLPTGLSISSTGAISGVTTTLQSATAYTVTATNSAGSTTATVSITVLRRAPSALVLSTSAVVFVAGVSGTTVTVSSVVGTAPIIYTASLPTGLSIDATTGTISGTATTASAATAYTVTATNSGGSTSAVVYITVLVLAPRALSLSTSSVAFLTNQVATPITATVTGNFVTFAVSPSLPTGLAISSSTGTISGTPTVVAASALYTVTATNAGGSVSATVTLVVVNAIVAPSALTLSTSSLSLAVGVAGSVTVSSLVGTPAFTYTVSPSLPSGLAISSSTGTISGTVTSAVASTAYTVTATNSAGSATATVTIAVVVVVPSALTYAPSSMTFYVGTSATLSVSSVAGTVPVTYTVSPSLPTGLSISSSTGQIAGTATIAQAVATYTVTATNSAGSTTAAVAITVSLTAPSALTYAASSLVFTSKVAGTSLTVSSVKGSATITYSITPSLPTGVVISAVSGRISGTPSSGAAMAATVYTVTATNSAGSTTAAVTITVNVVAPSSLVLSASVATWVASIASSVTVTSVSGTTPVTYTVSPSLPTGLSISSSTGTISGTITAVSAATTYTVTATNAAGSTSATVSIQAVLLLVAPSAIVLSSSSVTLATGASASVSVSSIVGTAPFRWTVSPSLPTGLSISSSTGAITGSSASAVATTTYTITAANDAGFTSVALPLAVVVQAPSALTYSSSSFTFTAGVVGSRFTVASIAGSLPVVYTVTGLPEGLAINSATGTIRGTVSGQVDASSATYTVTATNSMGSTTATVTIVVVVVPPSSLQLGSDAMTFVAGITNSVGVSSIIGSGPFVYTLTGGGSLPDGLSLSPAGRILGSATTAQTVTLYTITARNSAGSTTASVLISVALVAPSSLQLTATTITFTSGFPNSVSVLSVSGTLPMDYSVSPSLPAGLSISSTGTISGDGLVAQAATTYTVTATNAAGFTTRTVTITVEVVAPSALKLSTSSVTAVVGVATHVSVVSVTGTVPMTFTVVPALPTGLSLSSTTGTISGAIAAALATTTYTVTATNTEGSATAQVSITAASAAATVVPVGFAYSSPSAVYIINTKVPANKPTVVAAAAGGALTFTVTPSLPAGLTLSTTGYIKGTPTEISVLKTYTITVSNHFGSATAQVSLRVTATAPSNFRYQYNPIGYLINTETLNTPAVSGTATGMEYTVVAGAGALPDGVSLDASTGIMSGAPTSLGSGRFTVIASNDGGKASTVVSWSVSADVIAPSDFSYDVATLAYPSLGASDITVPVFFGTAPTFTVSPALPAGMALGEFTGVISGLPTEVGSQLYTVTATNDAGSVSTTITITVTEVPPAVVVYASRFSAYTVGEAITNTVTMTPAIGTQAAGTYTFTAPLLPAGLSIDAFTGVVSGTPTEQSDGTAYTITVSNTQGSLTFALNIRVMAADAVVVRTPAVPASLGFPLSLSSYTDLLKEKLLQEFANKVGLPRGLISQLRAFAPTLLSSGFHTEGVLGAFRAQRAAASTSSGFAAAETGGLAVELSIDTSSTDSSAVESFIVQQQEAEEFELPTFGAATVSSTVTVTSESSSAGDASSSGASGSSEASSGASVEVSSNSPVSSFTWGSAGGVVIAIIIALLCAAVVIGAVVMYRRFGTRGDKRLDDDVLVEVVSPAHGHHAMDVSPEHGAGVDASARAFAPSAASGAAPAAYGAVYAPPAPAAAEAPIASLHYSS